MQIYFFMLVMMYFLVAVTVTFGMISIGLGSKIQQLSFRYSFLGLTESKALLTLTLR